jgi:hypothetical protein
MASHGTASVNPQLPGNYSVLVFLKSLSAPVVLYSDNPISLYEEMKRHIQQAMPNSPKLLEKPGVGPLKKVSFLDTEISGVALQGDPSSR